MNWKIWVGLCILLLILLGAGIWTGWTLLNASNETDTTRTDNRPSVTQGNGEFSEKVTNRPVSESFILFEGDIPFEHGHDFVRQYHNFYNETLGWGKLSTAKYSEQREKAKEVIRAINSMKDLEDEQLKSDFEDIRSLAETVIEKDDREAMRNLHRYFHDLDIYLNGYDYHKTFQVTDFKGFSY